LLAVLVVILVRIYGLASKKTCGLGELVYYSLMKCDEKVRGELAANITLSGGNTKFPNLIRGWVPS